MVKDIEEFGAELKVAGLAEFCFLEHGEVHVAEVGPIDRVSAAIAKCSRRRHGERRRIKPVGNGLWMRIRINAGDAIRTLVDEIAVPEGIRPNIDGIGDSRPQNSQRGDAPARRQFAAEARAENAMSFTEWHVI